LSFNPNERRPKVTQYLYEPTGSDTLTAYGVTERLFTGQTRFQQMELWTSPDHGKLLLLDGELQSASKDEFIYHETLVIPAVVRNDKPRIALILGGGEGGTLRELLRPECMERVVMVDIDGEVVDLCRRVVPEHADGAFEDPRAELVIGDALKYLRETDESFDLIVSDLTEPTNVQNLSTSLFSVDAFRLVHSRLAPGGVFSLQASEGNLGQTESHLQIVRNLREVFKNVKTMLVHIPSFCCHWCFCVASDTAELSLSKEVVDERLTERSVEGLRFYDGETDVRLNSLPLYLRKELRAL
jgi:spermidine synthase